MVLLALRVVQWRFRHKIGLGDGGDRELLKRVPYEKDKVIFREGHDGTDAFVLESGRIGVANRVQPVHCLLLRVARRGDQPINQFFIGIG